MRKLFFLVCLCVSVLFVAGIAMSAEYRVLSIIGDSTGASESDVLESFPAVGGNTFSFSRLNIATGGTRPLDGGVIFADEIGNIDLFSYDILWFTWNGPGHDGDYFIEGVENELLSFVESGGVIYLSAFDDNYRDANGNQIGGWMPIDQYPATVSNTGDSELTLTPEGEATGIFDGVDLSGLVLDDNFANTDPAYTILAVRDDNGEPASVQLNYGAGAYIEVCIDARSTFPAAEPMFENLLDYMASIVALSTTSVEPTGKLSSCWGGLKSE